MDFGNAPRLAPPPGVLAVNRSDVVAQPGSVAVDLPPEQTVQSASAGDAVHIELGAQARDAQSRANGERRANDADRNGRASDQLLDETVERKLVVDPRTRSVIMQKKNKDTGETVSQLPDETLIKMRLYTRQLDERTRQAQESRHAIERSA